MPPLDPGMRSAIAVVLCCAVGAVVIAMTLPIRGALT